MIIGTEARNEKLFYIGTGTQRVAVLPLNGSMTHFSNPSESLRHVIETLDIPDHPGRPGQPLRLRLQDINEILGIAIPTPEQERSLTAILFGNTNIGEGPVEARRVEFSLGKTPMAAALVDARAAIYRIRIPRILIITDLPSQGYNLRG